MSASALATEVRHDADETAVQPTVDAGSMQPALSGTGFSYRHNWGNRRGQHVLRLNWGSVDPRSHVFVSIAEGAAGGPDNGKFVGSARYTLHNVAPRPGGVDIWVNIEWGSDIPIYVDYLVVNPPGMRTVSVTVHRHSTVALTDADADRILRDMGTALQSSDSPADVATRVRFVRNGAVRVLPATVPATIQTQAQWNTLLGAGTGVKVVGSIRWCGGPGGSIIGCAPVGIGNINLAVVRFTANQEGILWAHEYGHNAGLNHRSDNGRAVMFPSIGSDHNVVNSAESGRFMAGPLAMTGAESQMKTPCAHRDEVPLPADVREFVSQHWIEGVPYDAASQYTADDAALLVEWLVNEPEQHEEFLPEIVTTLCYIGSESAVEPLIGFVESEQAGQAVFNAKNAALIHLGDLIRASGSQAAADFLTQVATDMDTAAALSTPEVAASEATGPADAAAPSAQSLAAELAVSATLGLSLAGTPEAKQTIERLKSDSEAFAEVNMAAAEAAEMAVEDDSSGE